MEESKRQGMDPHLVQVDLGDRPIPRDATAHKKKEILIQGWFRQVQAGNCAKRLHLQGGVIRLWGMPISVKCIHIPSRHSLLANPHAHIRESLIPTSFAFIDCRDKALSCKMAWLLWSLFMLLILADYNAEAYAVGLVDNGSQYKVKSRTQITVWS